VHRPPPSGRVPPDLARSTVCRGHKWEWAVWGARACTGRRRGTLASSSTSSSSSNNNNSTSNSTSNSNSNSNSSSSRY
jgi:hypothetical protein